MVRSSFPLLPLVLDDVPWGLRQMLAQEGIPTVSRDRRGGRGCFLLFDSRHGPCRRPTPGQVIIDIDRLRTGFDVDPFEQWNDHRTWRFQWHLGDLRPSEEIGRVDKRGLRRQVMARLRRMIERRGGVWMSISAYPFPYRTVFNLRIDYDQYHARDFDRLQKVLAARQDSVSHFVNGAAYQPHGEALARLFGLDVGSHGYHHHTYRTYEENLRNIERGIQVLEEARLQPVGFTAPHGRFNRSLLEALEQLEIGHSSEFAAAHDELPFLPTGSSVLQIPVHPVCLGIVLEAARAAGAGRPCELRRAVDAATDHFLAVIRTKRDSREPIFLYGHPTGRLGRYPQLLESVFDEIESRRDVWRVTMSAWAAWWRRRSRLQFTVTPVGDWFVVDLQQNSGPDPVTLEYHRGNEVARIPLHGNHLRFSPDAIAYEELPEQSVFRPVRVDRPHGLRGSVRRWIDWERETPADEITPTNWRNVAKRTLRTLWR